MKLQENSLYVLECSYNESRKCARLVRIDLPTGEIAHGQFLEVPCFDDAFAPYCHRGRGEFPSTIDESNLYIGTQESGLAVFPLTGETPSIFAQDLPSDYVHGVGAMDGAVRLRYRHPLEKQGYTSYKPYPGLTSGAR